MNQSGSRKNRTKKSGFMVGWSRFLRDLQREGRFDPARKRDTTFRKNVEEEEEEGREGSAIKFLRKLLFVPAPPLSPSPPYANICPTTENRNTYSRQINTSEQSEQRNGGVGRLPRRTKYGAKVEMELVKRHCQRCVLLPCALPNKKKGRKREKSKKIKNERQTADVYRGTGKFLWDFLFFLFFLSLFFFVKKGKLNIFCLVIDSCHLRWDINSFRSLFQGSPREQYLGDIQDRLRGHGYASRSVSNRLSNKETKGDSFSRVSQIELNASLKPVS